MTTNPFELVKTEEMLIGYSARWFGEPYKAIAVEAEFYAPAPSSPGWADTAVAGDWYELGGKIDVLVRDLRTQDVVIVEHKCLSASSAVFDYETRTYRRADDLFFDQVPVTVAAMKEDGSIVLATSRPMAESGTQRVVEVQTLGGRSLRVSANHPIWTDMGWVHAGDLTCEHWLATPRRMPDCLREANETDESIRLIGYMIGDGTAGRNGIRFSKSDENVLGDVLYCASSIGEEQALHVQPGRKDKYIQFRTASGSPVIELMKRAGLYGHLSGTKRLPFHMALSDRQLGQMVGALWSTDGCIDGSTKLRIIYTSVSDGLCIDVQHALQRLGVASNVRRTSVEYKGKRRPVSTVQVVSRASKKEFLRLVQEGIIPVIRSAISLDAAMSIIPSSLQGNDLVLQPKVSDTIWWDRVELVSDAGEEMTYNLEVPGPHTFVVDGIVTHNSTIHDITEGAPYWAQTLMSTQLSTYMRGTRSLGHEPRYILYDVLARPQQRSFEATPIDKRKYTKPTKKEPIPRLYADQRENDETTDEFRLRIRAAIGKEPDEYFKRQRVERFQREEDEAARDLWYTTETMRLAKSLERYPRNPDACVQIGRVCTFLAVCAGHGTLDDPTKFRRVEDPHEELQGAGKRRLRVLTNSEISTFRTCQRLHHLRYNEGWRSVRTTEPQRMGTLIHRGLEGWWLGNMHGAPEWACVERGILMMREEPARAVVLPEELVA